MHELGITESLLTQVLQETRKAGLARVARINLVLGDMAGIAPDSVRFYFGEISKGTAAENAELCFGKQASKMLCRSCGATSSELATSCPNCHCGEIDVLPGRDFYLESIEED